MNRNILSIIENSTEILIIGVANVCLVFFLILTFRPSLSNDPIGILALKTMAMIVINGLMNCCFVKVEEG